MPRDRRTPGVGFTVTKKTGNSRSATASNAAFARRPACLRRRVPPQHDYVLVGRREALSEPFAKLVADLGA